MHMAHTDHKASKCYVYADGVYLLTLNAATIVSTAPPLDAHCSPNLCSSMEYP